MWSSTFDRLDAHCPTGRGSTAVARPPLKTRVGPKPAEAGPDPPDGPGLNLLNPTADLLDHARDCQRREVRLVEVWRPERDAVRRQPARKEDRLRRPGRRREAVEVEDLHHSRTVH